MSRCRIAVLVVAFVLDALFTAYDALSIGGATADDQTTDETAVALLLGRVVGLAGITLLAIRVALGHWPSRRESPSSDRCHAQELPALESPTGELAAVSAPVPAGAGRSPLLASSQQPSVQRSISQNGDERAAKIDEVITKQQAHLKKIERGLTWRNCLLIAAYLYVSICSMWTAVVVVSHDVSTTANVLSACAHVVCLVLANLEFMLLKRIVMDLTSGEPVVMAGIHEHALYWTNVEGKGIAMCSVCNTKVGEKTGGYLTLQCRQCEPGRMGFGGFQMCLQCYRKHAVKESVGGQGASGAGILRGDRGPKVAVPMTVLQYIKRLMGMMRKDTTVMMLIAVCGNQFVSTYIPKAQGDCINALVKGASEEFDKLILQFMVLVIASAVMGFAMSVAVSTLATRLLTDMAVKLFNALITQDIAFYDNAMTGQLNSRLTNDLRQAVSPINIIINSFLANIIMLSVGFVICFQSSWRLTILAFTFLAPLQHITTEFSKWASKLMATQYTYMADAQGSATQALTNIRTVRSFGAQDTELQKYKEHMQKANRVGITSAWGMGAANLMTGLVQQGASFIVLYYGGHLALGHNGFEVGSIITFTYLWNRLSGAFKGLNDNLNQPVKAMSAGQRVFEILDLKPDISEEGGEPFPQELQEVEVKLNDVVFNYQSRPDKQILQSVTLTLDAGKTTAIVGKSGCGKSTISKLLMRFYDPVEGSVTLNGTDLRKYNLPSVRTKVGIVSQDTQLFRMSVVGNITYGLAPESFTMADVEQAASLANADEFIRGLPEGYKTMLGEGGHDLSGGQKQRLSIARALVRKPRLLLLDEATSALDAENEAQVQQAINHLMLEMKLKGSCTIMVIAHRLSTIKDANRIIVMHEGSVDDQGTHDQLLHKKRQEIHSFESEKMGMSYDDHGFVKEVVDKGPAHAKGIQKGSRIVKVGDEPFSEAALVAAEESAKEYKVTFEVQGRYSTMIARQLASADGDGQADEDDNASSDEKIAKSAEKDIVRIIEALAEIQRTTVFKAIGTKFGKEIMRALKGGGKGFTRSGTM